MEQIKPKNPFLEFEFLERPMAKGRPRMCVKNGKTLVFTPQATRAYEKRLAIQVEKFMREKKIEKFAKNIPLKCRILAVYPILKTMKNSDFSEHAKSKILPTIKPDADNVLKIIFDSLNGVLYDDDAQICEVFFKKIYGKIPKILARFEEVKL